jgi:hypothetical protein
VAFLLVVTKGPQEKQSGGISMICDAFLEPNVIQHQSKVVLVALRQLCTTTRKERRE